MVVVGLLVVVLGQSGSSGLCGDGSGVRVSFGGVLCGFRVVSWDLGPESSSFLFRGGVYLGLLRCFLGG